ncbi:para-nitrobenzyl esterase [Marinactinospora thermotolerans DSM 45154]|uniref:Carboxylic ester hydrolase n=1 Tax=Marinactinospora thermotolerans DSM 45154 TaxID=1122192 RepID=A0A1T4TEG8_9ACTN|nr:carboxylesterase family protein [Marinactinospora thermotolerans]SKA38711.1 para-nitrobenzyl esterase [Marinactinospora thermotolerans DSM 45154]
MTGHPVVTTRTGRVRGRTVNGVHVFKGVPYAEPPVNALAFQPPEPAAPWAGERDAGAFGPTAPQPVFPQPADLDGFFPTVAGDDYLNLNVWTAELGRAGQPVMVWIHGGGFDGGSSIPYDGGRFARDGVVLVSVNHRLGAEGFLAPGDGIANLALLDQIAALRWVHHNITAFGGDPDNVTVFGESSGAMCVGALLAMPAARGLIRRAILQSGAGNLAQTPETARHVGGLLAARLGVAFTREAIATVPRQRLLDAQVAVMADLAPHPDPWRWGGEPGCRVTAWQPVIDEATLPRRPLDLLRSGAGADVDILVGTNSEEGRLSLVPFGALDTVTEADLATAARLYGLPPGRVHAAYGAADLGLGPGDLLALLQRDWWYRVPAYRLAEARAAAGHAVHVYEFAWRSPRFGGLLGACHFLEVPFVFDLLDDPRFRPLLGAEPPQRLADTVHAAWIAFAAGGDPGWPRYEVPRRPVLRFDDVVALVDDPRPAERALWEGVY